MERRRGYLGHFPRLCKIILHDVENLELERRLLANINVTAFLNCIDEHQKYK